MLSHDACGAERLHLRQIHRRVERLPEYWAGYISRLVNRDIKNKLGIDINARTFYLLGFHDYMVRNVREDETYKLITSVRDTNSTKQIVKMASEYGIVEKNVTTLKKMLLPYV